MDNHKKNEIKATVIIGMIMLVVTIFIGGCSATSKAVEVTLFCESERLHDFTEENGGRNYWTDMVTTKTLNSCRQVDYEKHVVYLSPEEAKQLNRWWRNVRH